MTGIFKPHMEILPPAQQRLWSKLSAATGLGFALYGGTAIALRLGHRTSINFDFFSPAAGPRCNPGSFPIHGPSYRSTG